MPVAEEEEETVGSAGVQRGADESSSSRRQSKGAVESRGGRTTASRSGFPVVATLLQRAASDKAEAARIFRGAPRIDRSAIRAEKPQTHSEAWPTVKGPRHPLGPLGRLAAQQSFNGGADAKLASSEAKPEDETPRREGGVFKGRGFKTSTEAIGTGEGGSSCLRGFSQPKASKTAKTQRPADASTAIHSTTEAYKAKAQTKVVVRNLPQGVSFKLLVELMPLELREALTWHWELPRRDRDTGPDRPAAIFLNFQSQSQAEAFCRLFNTRGIEGFGRGVAVLAPYQKVARQRSQTDKREGTVFEDADFIEFCKSIGQPNPGASSSSAGTPPVEDAGPALE